ncbi:MAG: hypothetical protein M3Y27_19480 [Acidobacteriota bacterium]|nr:hypothetical protein [Acidobacteriota bacterium]
MSTSAQQIANAANAQKSTGPITPEGKAHSAMNSHVHGLCAKDILVGPEEQLDFDSMAAKYLFDLSPSGAVERTLVSEIVGAAWQLGRVRRMETEACAGQSTYTGILDDEALQKKLDRLARHHTRIERTFHRCLRELKTLQAQRRQEGTITSDDLPRIQARIQRESAAALAVISERSQSASAPDESKPLIPKQVAEVDRDLDSTKAIIAGQPPKTSLRAA